MKTDLPLLPDAHLMAQIEQWLSKTDIAGLELRGPGMELALYNRGGACHRVPVDTLERTGDSLVAVCAGSVGVFLHRHPLHGQALARTGQHLQAGQMIGLLQIGILLLPVTAPQEGTFIRYRVPEGTTVGYGTALADLTSAPPAPKKGNLHGH